jgi:hypothetical protein
MKATNIAAKVVGMLYDEGNLALLAGLSKTPQGLNIEGLLPDAGATSMYLFEDGSSLIRRQRGEELSSVSLSADGTALLLKGIAAKIETITGKGIFNRIVEGAINLGFSVARGKEVLEAGKAIPALSEALERVTSNKPQPLKLAA